MSGFRPSRGKIAIQVIEKGCESKTGGIIYTQKENTVYGKAKVLSIGHPEISESGRIINAECEVGNYIIFDKKDGWGAYSGLLLIRYHQVVAIIDEDTEIA